MAEEPETANTGMNTFRRWAAEDEDEMYGECVDEDEGQGAPASGGDEDEAAALRKMIEDLKMENEKLRAEAADDDEEDCGLAPVEEAPAPKKMPGMGLSLNLGGMTETQQETVAKAVTARPKEAAEILKEKMTELHELQNKILAAPKGDRKALKKEAEALDAEIAALNAAFLRPVDAALSALNEAETEDAAAQALCMVKDITADASNPIMLKRCDQFGEQGIFEILDKVFTTHGHCEKVAEQGLAALSHLARSPGNRESMGKTMIPQAQEMMLSHVGAVLVAQAGCRTITNLSLQNPKNALELMPIGTIVVKAMEKHPDDTKMQLFGCLALNNLAINTKQLPTWEAEASEHISILIMKKRYADNKAIQQWAQSFMLVCDKRRAGESESCAKVTDVSKKVDS